MKQKTVYLNSSSAGVATTWHEAAAVVSKSLGRGITAREAQNHGTEGLDAFYIDIAPIPTTWFRAAL